MKKWLLLLLLVSSSVMSENYLITKGVDDQINNGNCTLREALAAAMTETTVDQCPAGDADLKLIKLDASVGTFLFNIGEFRATIDDVPDLTISSTSFDNRPVISMSLNNRFIKWTDFIDKKTKHTGFGLYFGNK